MTVYAIAALSENGAIGKDNDLIWHLPDDLKFFKNKTLKKVVIMGRKNFESIPEKYRPLPDRINVVLTRSKDFNADGAKVFHSMADAMNWCREEGYSEVFVIGGGEIYAEAIRSGMVDAMFLTRVHATFEGDTFFPDFDESKWEREVLEDHPADERHDYAFTFEKWVKK